MNMHLWIFTERQGLTYIHLKRVRKEKIQKKARSSQTNKAKIP